MTMSDVRTALILLAAGASRRFGDANKLLVDIDGIPLVQRVAQALAEGGLHRQLIVVLGHEASAIRSALTSVPATFVVNDDAAEGIGASIRCGITALPANAQGALIAQADTPALTSDLVARLIAAFEASGGQAIVHPATPDGRQGTPVVWPRALFAELAKLAGDRGGKPLLAHHPDKVVTVATDSATQVDLDTPDALQAWLASR
ncbi:MAG: NTP transferase domain-containing protein [Hyphomicrobiaceae bacterium]